MHYLSVQGESSMTNGRVELSRMYKIIIDCTKIQYPYAHHLHGIFTMNAGNLDFSRLFGDQMISLATRSLKFIVLQYFYSKIIEISSFARHFDDWIFQQISRAEHDLIDGINCSMYDLDNQNSSAPYQLSWQDDFTMLMQ